MSGITPVQPTPNGGYYNQVSQGVQNLATSQAVTTVSSLPSDTLQIGAVSLGVVLLPGSLLIWAVRRRTWSLRRLLVVPVAFAVAFTSLKIAGTLPFFQEFGDQETTAIINMAIMALPVWVFVGLLGAWVIRRHWMRLAGLLGLSLILSVLIGALVLWPDASTMSPLEHYSWNGWYMIWFVGAYATGAVVLVVLLAGPIVRAGWRKVRYLLGRATPD